MKLPHNQIPLLGQQQAQAKAHINAAIGQLAMQIYSQVAASHIVTRDTHQQLDVDELRKAASDSIQAAKCHFEAIGVIPIQEPTHET